MKLPAHLSSSLWLSAEQVAGDNVGWVNGTFWEMRSRGRWLAQQGLDAAAIMGDTCPMISPFSSSPCPRGEVDAKFWTVSRWAARFVDRFSQVSHADRLACWIVMFVTFQVRNSAGEGSDTIDQTILTARSGKYAKTPRRIARFQTGIDHSRSKPLSHTWPAWTS
jgi:hypothetical protein